MYLIHRDFILLANLHNRVNTVLFKSRTVKYVCTFSEENFRCFLYSKYDYLFAGLFGFNRYSIHSLVP